MTKQRQKLYDNSSETDTELNIVNDKGCSVVLIALL